MATTRTANAHHPDPRDDLSALTVASSSRYASYPRIAEVYDMAAEIPHVLDGLYCHCDCSKHSNHRSLLTCFQDDHGAGCVVAGGFTLNSLVASNVRPVSSSMNVTLTSSFARVGGVCHGKAST